MTTGGTYSDHCAVHTASPGLQKSKQHYSNSNFFPSARNSPTQGCHTLVTQYRLYTVHPVDFRHRESLKDSFTTRQSTPVYCVSGCGSMLDGSPLFPPPLPTSNLLLWTSNVIKGMAKPTAEQLCCRTVKPDAFTSLNWLC